MKSAYGKKIGSDTLFRWLISIAIFAGFYFWVYDFDARGTETDKWFHEVFGWKLSDAPSQAKVDWHRIAAGALAGVGIFGATLDFAVSLYRRIKARIAASKARTEQAIEEDLPTNTKP
jgi:hypothetical protein